MSSDPETDREGDPPFLGGDRFYRGHGLGNDYLVFEATETLGAGAWEVEASAVARICRRGEGVGSDGLLVLLGRDAAGGGYDVRGFNPDGTEFERSGNGLRVLASFLHREGLVGRESFAVRSGGCSIRMRVHEADAAGRYDVSVDMGRAAVGLEPVGGDPGALDPDGRAIHPELGPITFTPVSIGNPHAVVFAPVPSSAPLEEVGSFLCGHRAFARGINVQLAEVPGRNRLRIGVWERGVGRTSASGTSACASAVAGVSTGRLEPGPTIVEMDGGRLSVSVTESLEVTLRGPVEEVSEGRLASGFVRRLADPD